MKKSIEIIILPSKNSSKIGFIHESKSLHYYTGNEDLNNIGDNLVIPQHLYFLSDDEIKKGDWILANGSPYQVREIQGNDYKVDLCWISNVKKIIATTDESLITESWYESVDLGKQPTYKSLPRPSDAFIKVYIKEYNTGDKITKVLVEYYYKSINQDQSIFTPRINPRINTIDISLIY